MFYIVNDYDCPCKRLLCIMVGVKLKYIDPGYQSYDAMDTDEATPLKDFGFQIVSITDSLYQCRRTSDGIATYRDGKPRQWQGEEAFDIDLGLLFDAATVANTKFIKRNA